jgi:hypothetical protein
MKRTQSVLAVILILPLFLHFGCKSGKKEEQSMKEFLAMFNGTASQVATALEKYGANPEVVKSDMSLYDLKNPKIIKKKGDCYIVEFDIDIAVKMYEICWENDKISKINDIGLK